jgi:type IV pilus assembly protein PilW
MMDRRGFTLLELLIATLSGGIVLLGLFSLYVATHRSYLQTDSQAELQRKGTLAMEEIARQVRPATGLALGCNGPNSLQVTNGSATRCYFAGTDSSTAGQLCEVLGDSGCRNLLSGARVGIVLMKRPPPPATDTRCPPGGGSYCLALTVADTRADVGFAITDGTSVVSFSSSFRRRN